MAAGAAGAHRRSGIGARLAERYREVVASIYIYNEHRGYTALDRVLAAARMCCADERKHYPTYQHWLERGGKPLPYWRERLADAAIHKLLLLVKLPALFLHAGAERMVDWPDAGEPVQAT